MTPEELQRITGAHQMFIGIESFKWTLEQFRQCAQFAKAHGVDNLLVKVADGGNLWYEGIFGWHDRRNVILSEGVGAIPYIYSYGNKFGALDTEINILMDYMHDCGIVCMNSEAEWNGRVDWAQHLCSRVGAKALNEIFMVSTWANPSQQDWQGVIRELAPCTTVFMPQQYDNYLAGFWGEFVANGATWLQPTVNITGDPALEPNDPVAIARDAYKQGHTGISVWEHQDAVRRPDLLDAVLAAFPKLEDTPMQLYGPGAGDFDTYFTEDINGNWTCKKEPHAVLFGGNLALYKQLSVDGSTLPVIGLPLENEQYHHDPDGYSWSSQKCERALMVYDPEFRKDKQPGLGTCYLAHIDQDILNKQMQAQLASLQEKLDQIGKIATS